MWVHDDCVVQTRLQEGNPEVVSTGHGASSGWWTALVRTMKQFSHSNKLRKWYGYLETQADTKEGENNTSMTMKITIQINQSIHDDHGYESLWWVGCTHKYWALSLEEFLVFYSFINKIMRKNSVRGHIRYSVLLLNVPEARCDMS